MKRAFEVCDFRLTSLPATQVESRFLTVIPVRESRSFFIP